MRQLSMFNFLLVLLFATSSFATSLSERVIGGRKLIDIVKTYTVEDNSGEQVHIPEKAIDDAFEFFDRYQNTSRTFLHKTIMAVDKKPQYSGFRKQVEQTSGPTIGNKYTMVIFDLDQPSSAQRLHIINLVSGNIESIEASHGKDSECRNKPLFACNFISDRDSAGTPLGFFSTGRSYYGEKHAGISISMDGLEDGSPNRLPGGNDFPSTIIIHSADYVRPGAAGRSHGCVSLSLTNMNRFDNSLAGGALFYFYHSSLENSGEPVVSGLR